MAAPKIKADPQNPKTVILDRWPDESEKNQAFNDKVKSIRRPVKKAAAPKVEEEVEEAEAE